MSRLNQTISGAKTKAKSGAKAKTPIKSAAAKKLVTKKGSVKKAATPKKGAKKSPAAKATKGKSPVSERYLHLLRFVFGTFVLNRGPRSASATIMYLSGFIVLAAGMIAWSYCSYFGNGGWRWCYLLTLVSPRCVPLHVAVVFATDVPVIYGNHH